MKEKNEIHYARLNKSERLQRVHKLLSSGTELSTWNISRMAAVCAVNSIICELRKNGVNIAPARRINGAFYYKMVN
jgi:hypothetical protein